MSLETQERVTVTDKMVQAVADSLARFHGGNAVLNLLEAEHLLHTALASIDDSVSASSLARDLHALEEWCFDQE